MEDDSVLDTNMQTMSMKQLNLSSAVAISTNPQTLCLLGWKRNIWLLALVWVQVLAAEFARADLYVSLAAEKANYSALENMGPFTSYVTIKDNIQKPVMITSITSSGPVFKNGDLNDALSSVNLVNPPAVPFSLPPNVANNSLQRFNFNWTTVDTLIGSTPPDNGVWTDTFTVGYSANAVHSGLPITGSVNLVVQFTVNDPPAATPEPGQIFASSLLVLVGAGRLLYWRKFQPNRAS